MALNIIKNYLTKNRCYQQAVKRTPIGIQLHTIGCAQGTAQSVADYWNQSAVSACVHYIVDCDTPGKVLATLPEEYYAWADAGYGNRNLITFEICESDHMKYTGGADYTVTDQAKFKADILRGYQTAVLLCADICGRHGWNPTAKLSSGLYLISSHDEGRRAGLSSAHVDPTHVWNPLGLTMDQFRKDVALAMTGEMPAQPATEPIYRVRKTWTDVSSQLFAGTLEGAMRNCQPGYSVYDEDGNHVYTNDPKGFQAADLKGLSEADVISKVAPLYVESAKTTGMLPSAGIAQFCLESGYGSTDLAQFANNVHGMKCSLSGNTWERSVWDGESKYTKKTAEQDAAGNVHYEKADFRKYPCVEDSIADRAAYFSGAMNGNQKRYPGLVGERDYRKAIQIIKDGGYATDVNYVDKLCNLVERWKLTQYDADFSGAAAGDSGADILPETDQSWYRVRLSCGSGMTGQIGAYHDLEKAKACVNENWQYNVYGEDGNCIYNGAQALVDRAVDWMIGIANDDTHGYINGKWGPEYSCLSLVEMGYINAGLSITKSNIDKMPANLIKAGFEDCTAEGNLKTGGGLAKGDILWMLDATGKHGHVECYIGDGKLVGARGDTDGKAGDSRGDEISIIAYQNMSWQKVFRLPGAYTGEEDVSSGGTGNATDTTYRVQAGAYKKKTLARDALKKVRAAGYQDAFIREEGNMYKIQAWSGSREGAEKIINDLKAKSINAIIRK